MTGPIGRWRPVAATVVSMVVLAAGARAQVLLDLQRGALLGDPGVAAAQAQVRAAEERVFQARAGFGPTAVAAVSRNDTRYKEAPAFELRPFASNVKQIQVTQPLLRGTLFPALDSAQAQLEQLRAALDQARADATVRLLESAFEVLKARDTIAFNRAQQVAAQEQLASARRAFAVGTVSVIDVREAEAKIDTVAAQAIAAQADLELRQQLLAEIAGRDAPELLDRGLTGERMPALEAGGVLGWLADATARNPQLRQAQQALLAAEAEVRKAAQGHAPTVDLNFNYTESRDTGTFTSIFPRRGNSTQAGFTLNMPLFASGATQSKVREAVALRDKAQSDVDAARRAVQLAVRQSFTAALSSTSLAQGLETANRSLDAALTANRRGYEVGLKVNAEVLESQSRVFDARRELSRARYDAWLALFRLKAAAGSLNDADVSELDALVGPVPQAVPRGRGTQGRP